MKRLVSITAGLIVAGGLFGTVCQNCRALEPAVTTGQQPADDVVTIAIRANAQCDSSVIRLGDVANITGGESGLRNQLKMLDLEDGLAPTESILIQPPQIEFRLRLAGVNLEKISIRGAAVRVTSRSASPARTAKTITSAAAISTNSRAVTGPRISIDLGAFSLDEGPLEREIVQTAKACILSKLPWPAESVDIRLAQSLPTEVRQVDSATGFECLAELKTTGPAVGRVQVRVIAEGPAKKAFDLLLIMDVRHFDDVVMTAKSLDRGHVIRANDLFVDRQDVTDLQEYSSKSSDLLGSTMKRPVRALQLLRSSDLETVARGENSVLVKRRDPVKMIARIGGMSIIATGEALQDGRLKELIRMKNTESGAVVQGRVVAPGEVEVAY